MSENLRSYWTAFYTKPRNEKKSADRLMSKGVEIFCPVRTVLKQWSDRKKKVVEPIFTSYLFAKIDELSRVEVLMDTGIVSNVHWLGKPVVIKEQEISEIKYFLEEFPMASVSSKEYVPNEVVQITSGPLTGLSGVVRYVKGNKVHLIIESLGVELRAELNMNRLLKIRSD